MFPSLIFPQKDPLLETVVATKRPEFELTDRRYSSSATDPSSSDHTPVTSERLGAESASQSELNNLGCSDIIIGSAKGKKVLQPV